jgi:hypothetical protein
VIHIRTLSGLQGCDPIQSFAFEYGDDEVHPVFVRGEVSGVMVKVTLHEKSLIFPWGAVVLIRHGYRER